MTYRTDEDRTEERISALRDQHARQVDTLDQLDREHQTLTGKRTKRPRLESPELNACTDDDRIALLNFANDKLRDEILAQRRVNDELKRGQHADIGSDAIRSYIRPWWHFFFKLARKV